MTKSRHRLTAVEVVVGEEKFFCEENEMLFRNDSRDDYREERGAGGSRDYPKQNGGFDGGLGISDRQSFSDWKEPRRSDERRDDREEPYFGQGRRQAPAPASSRHHD